MKKLLILIVCFACAAPKTGFAQDASEIPGLRADLKKAKTATERVDVLAQLCFAYADANIDTGLLYGNQAIALAKKINYSKGLGDGLNNIGWSYYRNSNFTKAEESFKASLGVFKKNGDKQLIKIPLSNLGTLYTDRGEYAKAITCLKEAYGYDVEMRDTTSKNAGLTLYSIGRVYNRLQEFGEARKYFIKDSAIQSNLHDSLRTSQAVMSIGNTYLSEDNYQKALTDYKQALAYINNSNDYYSKGIATENIALCYEALKKHTLAIKYYKQSLRDYAILKDKDDMFDASTGLAAVYEELKDTVSQKATLDSMLKYAIELNDKNLQQITFKNLSSLYYAQAKYKPAYELLDSAYAIKDSVLTIEKQNEILKLKTQFETEKKEKENELLKAENETSAAQLKQNKIFLAAAITGVVLLCGLLYALYKNRQAKIKNINNLKQLNEQLNQQKEQISSMNVLLQIKALNSQIQPHFIFNCMSSIQESILTGRIDDASDYLSKLARLMRLVFTFAMDDMVTLDKDLDMLTLYLQLEKARLRDSFTYSIAIEEEIITEDVLVPSFILQPYAENAIWHGLLNKAGNRQLLIDIKTGDNLLICTVQDNGIGRTKADTLPKKHKQPGLRSMQLLEKRIAIIKEQQQLAEVSVQVNDIIDEQGNAAGTAVVIILPLIFA